MNTIHLRPLEFSQDTKTYERTKLRGCTVRSSCCSFKKLQLVGVCIFLPLVTNLEEVHSLGKE